MSDRPIARQPRRSRHTHFHLQPHPNPHPYPSTRPAHSHVTPAPSSRRHAAPPSLVSPTAIVPASSPSLGPRQGSARANQSRYGDVKSQRSDPHDALRSPVSASTETSIPPVQTAAPSLSHSHTLLAQARPPRLGNACSIIGLGASDDLAAVAPTATPPAPSNISSLSITNDAAAAAAHRPRLFPSFIPGPPGRTRPAPPLQRIIIPRLPLATPSPNLPNLLAIEALTPDAIAATREIDDHRTRPFSTSAPPYTDLDVPLPQPYNPAYPHPLTAYASPGVNSAAIRVVRWRQALEDMIATDPDTVKGSILAASDKDISPPALMIPVFEGEGCGIPERLWTRFESMGEAPPPSQLDLGPRSTPSAGIPPRFAQAGIHVVATPGNRHFPTLSSATSATSPSAEVSLATAAAAFPAVRTNFSNVLRRTSNDFDAARAPIPSRRATQAIAAVPTPFHKTEICRAWEHEGTCKYGSNCQFAHGLLELRMPVSGMPTPPHQYDALVQSQSRYEDPPKPVTPPRMRQQASPAAQHARPFSSIPPTSRPYAQQQLWQQAQIRPEYGYIEELDSPVSLYHAVAPPAPTPNHHHAPASSAPPRPIGAERAWRTVPVPEHSSHNTIRPFTTTSVPSVPASSTSTEIKYNYHVRSPPGTYAAAAPPSLEPKTSSSSLSASAKSFHSTTAHPYISLAPGRNGSGTITPPPSSLGMSYSTSSTSGYIASPVSPYEYSYDASPFRPYVASVGRFPVPVPRAGAGAGAAEGETREWEVIKRSIDATVIGSS